MKRNITHVRMMEHLIYQPLERTFRAEIRDAARPLKVSDWSLKDHSDGSCPPVYPRIPWLGHPHEDSSHFQEADPEPHSMEEIFVNHYGTNWNFDGPIQSPDLRYIHVSLEELEDADVIRHITAFVQSWLFFGLLEAISERPIDVSYFVKPGEDNTNWLYTRNLPALLEFWQRQLSALNTKARDSKLRQARHCAIRANSILSDFLFGNEENATSTLYLQFRQMLMSIEPALSALHEAVAAKVDFYFQNEVRSFGAVDYPFHRGYSKRLIQRGWCPFVIASAEIAMSVSFLRYIDATGYVPSNKAHGRCTSDACKRNDIDLDTYTQLHWKPRCRCHPIKPDIDEIFRILDADLIPVVQLSRDRTRFELRSVVPDAAEAGYIAFSHVWADGLGSCSEQGLRECQVERLHQLAGTGLTHGAWFWIDGLCVPKLEPYRGKAIRQMKSTYRGATGVIVLDSNLHQISKSSSIIEIGWALFASGWMGRLWTYQEGFLPQWVVLELSDGCYDLYELIQRLYNAYYDYIGNPFPHIFLQGLLAALQKTRPLDLQAHNRARSRKIVDTFNVLTRRRTSRTDDQILIIALMLDLDMDYLMTFTGEARWKEFYIALKEIPWTIVFDQRPKMSLPGFKWAPNSWISHGKDEWLQYDDLLAQCYDGGLRVNITVLTLHEVCTFGEFEYRIRVENDLYELSRLASNPISTTPFNIIFVRYLNQETPQATLLSHSSVLTGVGVGFIDSITPNQLQYEFSGGWNIQLLAEHLEDHPVALKTVTGKWEKRDLVFT